VRLGAQVSVGRYYDPSTGEFLSVDPLVDVTGEPYGYAIQNPVNLTDPSGQSVPLDFGEPGSIFTASGGSNGAHPGEPVWGTGQLNGYSCVQNAWDQNLPGVRQSLGQVFGDLSGPTGWSYWEPLAEFGLFPIGGFDLVEGEIVAEIAADGLFEATIATESGDVTVLAEASVSGRQLTLNAVTIGGRAEDLVNEVGAGAFIRAKDGLAKWAAGHGFDTLRIVGERVAGSSSANPGKVIDVTINLAKYR
jgi:hypothetical protein